MLMYLFLSLLLIVAYDLTMLLLQRPLIPESMQWLFIQAEHQTFLLWIALVITAPLFEEFLFRGILFHKLQQSAVGPFASIILIAFLWAVIHIQYDIVDMIGVFIAGIWLGILRYKTATLWVPIIIHMVWNAIASLQTELLVRNIWPSFLVLTQDFTILDGV
jgi:membrane protease YdiL (CAAX protease family)